VIPGRIRRRAPRTVSAAAAVAQSRHRRVAVAHDGESPYRGPGARVMTSEIASFPAEGAG